MRLKEPAAPAAIIPENWHKRLILSRELREWAKVFLPPDYIKWLVILIISLYVVGPAISPCQEGQTTHFSLSFSGLKYDCAAAKQDLNQTPKTESDARYRLDHLETDFNRELLRKNSVFTGDEKGNRQYPDLRRHHRPPADLHRTTSIRPMVGRKHSDLPDRPP